MKPIENKSRGRSWASFAEAREYGRGPHAHIWVQASGPSPERRGERGWCWRGGGGACRKDMNGDHSKRHGNRPYPALPVSKQEMGRKWLWREAGKNGGKL